MIKHNKSKNFGIVTLEEWKTILKKWKMEWKHIDEMSDNSGKFWCLHEYGTPNKKLNITIPPTYICCSILYENGVIIKEGRHHYLNYGDILPVKQCCKCGHIHITNEIANQYD